MALWEYLPRGADPVYKRWRSRTYGMKLKMLHGIICPEKEIDSVSSHFAGDDAMMTWDIFCYYKQYATYHELKWKYSFPVQSSKYTGIKVSSTIRPLNLLR